MRFNMSDKLETLGAWMLAGIWAMPLLFALIASIYPPVFLQTFDFTTPLTGANYAEAWNTAPFVRYLFNTMAYTTLTTTFQFILCTLAAYAFARYEFPFKNVLFAIFLLQLIITPDQLIVENYNTMSKMGLVDTIAGISLPYMASGFGVFLLRQTFKQVPHELEEAAIVEGAGPLKVLWKVYVPLGRPTYLAYGLVSVSWHWNNFLWPMIITNSVDTRPLTVGLAIFGAPESGVDFSVISAGTIIVVAPLLLAFILMQKQFVQSFIRSGIK